MRILIAYAGKRGTTKECVERLQTALKHKDVFVVDLNREIPRVEDYDLCIVGASVRFGRLQKSARNFLKAQEEALLQKPLGLFFCCGLPHESEYYREVLFSKQLRKHAFECLYFGGSLQYEGLPFWERMLIKSIRSSIVESEFEDGEYTPSLPGILPEQIDQMAIHIRREFLAVSS